MTSDREMYSRSFQPIDPEVRERFIAYAGGYATGLKARFILGEEVTVQERDWLMVNTGRATLESPYNGPEPSLEDWLAICQELMDPYTLQQITQRMKS